MTRERFGGLDFGIKKGKRYNAVSSVVSGNDASEVVDRLNLKKILRRTDIVLRILKDS